MLKESKPKTIINPLNEIRIEGIVGATPNTSYYDDKMYHSFSIHTTRSRATRKNEFGDVFTHGYWFDILAEERVKKHQKVSIVGRLITKPHTDDMGYRTTRVFIVASEVKVISE